MKAFTRPVAVKLASEPTALQHGTTACPIGQTIVHHARWAGILLAATSMVASTGCEPLPGKKNAQPSYAELLVIYNAEMESLDRLEQKRSELIADYERQLRPSAEDAVRVLTDALSAVRDEKDAPRPTAVRDPFRDLDRAVDNAEKVQQATTQLLDAANQPPDPAAAAAREAITQEFNSRLAELDQEIERQQARVGRAREARDAAEQQDDTAQK
jgi:hypothetical protein